MPSLVSRKTYMNFDECWSLETIFQFCGKEILLYIFSLGGFSHNTEFHQEVMTDRRHSFKRGDRLSKKIDKRQLLTGKKRQIVICVMGQK